MEWREPRNRFSGAGDHNVLPCRDLLKKPGEIRLGFMNVDLYHTLQNKLIS